MAERLGVNIFSGVLPSSYVLVDNGEDSSKWLPSLPNWWVVANDMTSIVEGDSFGFYGKGLEFKYTTGGALAISGNAFRPFPLTQIRTLLGGFVFRVPNDWWRTGTIYLSFTLTPIDSPLTLYEPVFAISCTNVPGVSDRIKVNFNGTTDVYDKLYEEDDDLLASAWHRMKFRFDFVNKVMDSFSFDGLQYPLTVPITSSGLAGALLPSFVYLSLFQNSIGSDLLVDVDQLWLSDTEYRV